MAKRQGKQIAQQCNFSQASRISSIFGGCVYNCTCEKCTSQGYTTQPILQSQDKVIFTAPIMVRKFVSHHLQMVGQKSLTLKNLHIYEVKTLTKLKCSHINIIPGLIHLYLTINDQDTREEINVNFSQLYEWFINIVLVRLYHSTKLGIPFCKFNGKCIGPVYIHYFFGGWKVTNIEITDRLRIENGKQIKIINELWTRFQILKLTNSYLIIKFWDGLKKYEIGLPLNKLSIWLMAFLSLVKD